MFDETKVLSWMTSGVPRPRPARGPVVISAAFGRVGDQVAGSFTGVDVQAGDTPGVVVVEHQPGALLVGVIEGLAAVVRRTADVHVRDVRDADALGIGGVLASGSDPLVGGAIADPGGDAAMQVQGGAVLGEALGSASGSHVAFSTHGVANPIHNTIAVSRSGCHSVWPHTRTHDRRVDRDEQVAVHAFWQQVVEDDANGLVPGGEDRRTEVLGCCDAINLRGAAHIIDSASDVVLRPVQ